MLKKNDYLMYKRDVCQVIDLKPNYFNNEDYYTIVPIADDSLKIEVPISNKFGYIRPLLTKKEVEQIISDIPSIQLIETQDRLIENEYKKLLKSSNHEDLIKIIKTTYLRNKNRIDNNKKIGDKDHQYFKKAEQFLYSEFSVVLDMSYEDTKKYVTKKVNEATK